jgi:hypothetical protein
MQGPASVWLFHEIFVAGPKLRDRGRIGSNGQEMVEIHADEIAAGRALEAIARGA